ncbi:hypothetical protein TB2_019726 [Malus domestica]
MAFVTLGCWSARAYPGIQEISGLGRVTCFPKLLATLKAGPTWLLQSDPPAKLLSSPFKLLVTESNKEACSAAQQRERHRDQK